MIKSRKQKIRKVKSIVSVFATMTLASLAFFSLAVVLFSLAKQAYMILCDSSVFSLNELGPMLNVIVLVSLTACVVVPWGVLLAVYSYEYSENFFAKVLWRVFSLVNCFPSIVLSVMAWLILSKIMLAKGFAAGLCALVLILLPVFTQKCVHKLNKVSIHIREASLTLGMSRRQAIFKVLLPSSKITLLWAFLYVSVRALGLTTPLLLVTYDWGVRDSLYSTLPTEIYHKGFSNSDTSTGWLYCLLLVSIIWLLDWVLVLKYKESDV